MAGSVIFDTMHGIMGKRVTLMQTTVSGLDGLGASATKFRAYDSELTDNCQALDYATCKDLYASRRPVLEGTSCDASWNARREEPWGVCSTD
jgi:hypothetical protein